MKYGHPITAFFLAISALASPKMAPDREFLGIVTKVKGHALYKNSHFDRSPKPVRVGLKYYPGYEFLTPKGAYLELLDENVGMRACDKGEGVWKRAMLKLNDTQKELVSHLSDMGWSISREAGSSFIDIPSHSSRMPLDSMVIVRNPGTLNEVLSLTILGSDGHVFFSGAVPKSRMTFKLSEGTMTSLRQWADGNERIISCRFDTANGPFTRRIHLLNSRQAEQLTKELSASKSKNQLTLILLRASAYERAGCNDLAALSLSNLKNPQFAIDELLPLRGKPFANVGVNQSKVPK